MMKSKIMHKLLFLLAAVTLLVVSCDKNNNEDPDVKFNAGSYIHQVSSSVFYKYTKGQLSQITVTSPTEIDTAAISSVNVPMYGDTIFGAVNGAIVAIAGKSVFFSFDGRSDGLVLYAGDSTAGVSHIFADWPYATGTVVERDVDQHGEAIYTYAQPGTYTAQMVARNYRDIEHDAKEQVKSITVTVLDAADIPLTK